MLHSGFCAEQEQGPETVLVFLHVLVCSSFTLIYPIAKADGALLDKGMVLCLLGTHLWKLPGTCNLNLNFSWDSPGRPLTLHCSRVPWSLRQRGHISCCWNCFQTVLVFPLAFTQCLCCIVGTWLTLCWTTFFCLLEFFLRLGRLLLLPSEHLLLPVLFASSLSDTPDM